MTAYTYYWGGQLKTKTDARSWVTTDTLDELERLKTRTYSAASGTSTVDYAYDIEPAGSGCTSGATGYPIDQLKSVSNGDSLTEFGCRDLLGRPRWSRQVTNSASYPFQYTYQPAGLKEETYPSQLKVETVYDDALRPITVKGTRGSTVTNHVLNAGYTAHGAVSSLPFGNGLTETRTYNGRLQPQTIQVGSLLTLNLTYYPTAAGSLKKQIITRSGSTPWTQDYTYDAIERLKTATETGGGSWSETYDYDERGNRWLSPRTGNLPTPTAETPVAGSWFAANNRINSWTYDSAGNLSISPNRTLTYNAENLVSQANVGGQVSTYKYDGEGRRVMKTTPNGTVVFVYDAMGQLAAEYGPNAATGASPGVRYLSQDHLGSTRLTTTSAGAVERNYDYLPFGEEIGAGWAGRSGSFSAGTYPSTPSGVQHKFTGKERDAETGLDYFIERYFGAAQGRFSSTDPENAGASSASPQTWNAYSYAGNNPLRFTDPFGEDYRVCDSAGKNCANLTDSQYEDWRANNPGIQQRAGDRLFVTNDNGSETTVGSASWFDGAAAARANAAAAFIPAYLGEVGKQALFSLTGTVAIRWGFQAWRAARGVQLASGATGEIGSMQVIRTIKKGESIADLANEAKAITFQTGNEVAAVKLANGQRALVSGGPGGIQLQGVTRVYGHTHPFGNVGPVVPSASDVSALQSLGQRSSYILERGQVLKFGVK
jgi:RHS repeat-associated protein